VAGFPDGVHESLLLVHERLVPPRAAGDGRGTFRGAPRQHQPRKTLRVLPGALRHFFIGWANLIGYNVTSTLLPKPEASYTAADRQQVEDFRHYRELQKMDAAKFTAEQNADYTRLDDLYKKKQLRSSVSYVRPWQFYVCFTIIVGCYLIMGGMTGAARNEVLQGILIVTFSMLLIPFGFTRSRRVEKAASRCCASGCPMK
jgi:hypothetical protein